MQFKLLSCCEFSFFLGLELYNFCSYIEVDLQKIESLGGRFEIFCKKGGINLKRGGVDVEMGGVATFLLPDSLITFTVCVGKVRLPLLLFESSVF